MIYLTTYLILSLFFVSTSTEIKNEDPKHKGFTWVGGRQIEKSDFLPLMETGADWITLVPFGYMKNYNSTHINIPGNKSYYWGESDNGIITTAKYARDHGLKIMLKPHIWLINMDEGQWRGTIRMDSDDEWDTWFNSYEKYILHYAKIAEEDSMEAFCIGTEFHIAAKYHERKWRSLINKIRSVYSGEITYAANWSEEYLDIRFWDALDFIGIQAYFPLTTSEKPSIKTLETGWSDHLGDIQALSKKYDKPILFTEIGYKSMKSAAIDPWVWPSRQRTDPSIICHETQSNCYQAFFNVFWDKDWFLGVHFWEWYPDDDRSGGMSNHGFTPQNKPAEKIIKKWFN